MTTAYVQVRPVREEEDGCCLTRAFEGDTIFAWGVYVTDADGLPMHETDHNTRKAALNEARQRASKLGVSVAIDELNGTTTWELP